MMLIISILLGLIIILLLLGAVGLFLFWLILGLYFVIGVIERKPNWATEYLHRRV